MMKTLCPDRALGPWNREEHIQKVFFLNSFGMTPDFEVFLDPSIGRSCHTQLKLEVWNCFPCNKNLRWRHTSWIEPFLESANALKRSFLISNSNPVLFMTRTIDFIFFCFYNTPICRLWKAKEAVGPGTVEPSILDRVYGPDSEKKSNRVLKLTIVRTQIVSLPGVNIMYDRNRSEWFAEFSWSN